jgi:ribosomal protein L33
MTISYFLFLCCFQLLFSLPSMLSFLRYSCVNSVQPFSGRVLQFTKNPSPPSLLHMTKQFATKRARPPVNSLRPRKFVKVDPRLRPDQVAKLVSERKGDRRDDRKYQSKDSSQNTDHRLDDTKYQSNSRQNTDHDAHLGPSSFSSYRSRTSPSAGNSFKPKDNGKVFKKNQENSEVREAHPKRDVSQRTTSFQSSKHNLVKAAPVSSPRDLTIKEQFAIILKGKEK